MFYLVTLITLSPTSPTTYGYIQSDEISETMRAGAHAFAVVRSYNKNIQRGQKSDRARVF